MEIDTGQIQVNLFEAARALGLKYQSLRVATRMGLTPFRRRSQDGSKSSWLATVSDVEAWTKTEDFNRIEREKVDA